MNIAISGSSGFIGSALSDYLEKKGHKIIPLGRKYFIDGSDLLYNELTSCEVIINLAGATINKRWTEDYKNEIIQSRINVTRKIVNTISRLPVKPKLLISASAIGCYPIGQESDENTHTESNTFLAIVCKEWEQEAMKSQAKRTVICRFGVVLSPYGGALQQIMLPLKFNIAVKFSSGNLPFSWISLKDLIKVIAFIISHDDIKGIVNCVAPEVTTYNRIVDKLKKSMHVFISFTIHNFLKNIIFQEMGSMITGGQNVIPQRLKESGFTFTYPDIDSFINDEVPSTDKGKI